MRASSMDTQMGNISIDHDVEKVVTHASPYIVGEA